MKSNNYCLRHENKKRPPTVMIRRCLTQKAAHYNQRSVIRGASQVVGIKAGFLAIKEKSANNAHGAYNGSYAIMRAEIKGASNEQHCKHC
ncbi:hypothetical protein [Pseudomonas mandelii]|uniref:hypothetical protein n=1 Tax=Pseudomonas mandelii TaxID=75612 RepID=UPI001125ED0B|nr:hypothetical protein [Pseudomonas mandelii]